ncbi:winged helix-turn-helix transcriptional regulator [Maritalea porphyrae]|uniref:HTH hxlR-type domain-containing protein n=1 Tax=Maritalea porphyrae TaxID=880732 RepID=A0ABQ5UNL5_9HYPH|nr:winged helix-turn-helix transcriptional regulator [Maritalea porphyrae]GLQ16247.1 hypothetical protein GCM10007879_04960 [Maritalea porphyrae]
MDIEEIVKLSAKSWSIKILALMHSGVPGRQAPLLAASGAGRTAFGQSLQYLIEIGMAERNPGHGHPLRPEFRLTKKGIIAAKTAADVLNCLDENDDGFALMRKTWTLPVVALIGKPKRFSEIKSMLPSITDRALSQSLLQLEESGWLQREIVIEGRHPYPSYQASGIGIKIEQVLNQQF